MAWDLYTKAKNDSRQKLSKNLRLFWLFGEKTIPARSSSQESLPNATLGCLINKNFETPTKEKLTNKDLLFYNNQMQIFQNNIILINYYKTRHTPKLFSKVDLWQGSCRSHVSTWSVSIFFIEFDTFVQIILRYDLIKALPYNSWNLSISRRNWTVIKETI